MSNANILSASQEDWPTAFEEDEEEGNWLQEDFGRALDETIDQQMAQREAAIDQACCNQNPISSCKMQMHVE
jgi:hypothetical protein